MNYLFNLVNTYPSPYFDLIVVSVLFVFLYLVVFVFSRFVEKREIIQEPSSFEEVKEKPASRQTPPADEIPEIIKTESVFVVNEPPLVAEQTSIKVDTPKISEETIEPDLQPSVETVPREEKSEVAEREGVFSNLIRGLSKTNAGLLGKLENLLLKKEIDSDLWDEFEELLISSDIGVATTMKLREKIETSLSGSSLEESREVRAELKDEILHILSNAEGKAIEIVHKPTVMVVGGVNGVGKTTTIGKLANKFIKNDYKVMVAACDTFRAAATEQLEVWSKRVGSDFVKGNPGADPSAVAYDALNASKARDIDILIIDTAGRLHTKAKLMDELKKINRVIGREISGAPHEVLMVLDATTGQNALQQARTFKEAINVTGVALTKLDGTAKGGIIIAIADELNIPVKYIGIGESLDDLKEFNADEFVEALFFSEDEIIH